MNDKNFEIYKNGYSEGFIDDSKAGKIETLNELMKIF